MTDSEDRITREDIIAIMEHIDGHSCCYVGPSYKYHVDLMYKLARMAYTEWNGEQR